MERFKHNLLNELRFRFSRSSGPGGQNVNKVNTRVEVLFNINESEALSDEEKAHLHKKLASKINQDGFLLVSSQSSRSQIQNKQDAQYKIQALVENALKIPTKRKATKPSRSSKLKRLEQKKMHALKKKNRKTLGF